MKQYKQDFPILQQDIHGHPLIYLDSSSSSQKPACVLAAMDHYYRNDHANVHRGVYQLSERATAAYEAARRKTQQFINAKHAHEIIFTHGTTESINLVAMSFARAFLAPGDEIIITAMEHHSNIVPWQQLQTYFQIKLLIVPINETGELDLACYQQLFSARTRLVAVSHASNVLGTINPIEQMIAIAHAHQVPVLVDGAQAFPHLPVDVQALDCDFYTFSAHKAYGPTGVGVLYGKTQFLEKMPPFQSGGSMIETVTFAKTTFSKLPYKFEAGTPNIAGVVGFHAALTYLEEITMPAIQQHEQELLAYATAQLMTVPGLRIIGTAADKVGVISFVLDAIHPHDIGTILDHHGIAVRAGHHCAMPLMAHFQIPACVRVSFGVYNALADVDALMKGLATVERLFHDGAA